LGLALVLNPALAEDKEDALETERQHRLLEWPRAEANDLSLRDFIRVVSMWSDDRTGTIVTLQTSVRCLRKPGTDKRIVLVSVHHFGCADYYRGIAQYLAADAKILREGQGDVPKSERCEFLLLVERYQRGLTRRMNLIHENTWCPRVDGASWRQLDMPLPEINRRCAGLPAAVVEGLRKRVAFIEGDASDASLWEHVLTEAMTAEVDVDRLNGLDVARERIIFDGLKDEIASGATKIVLMYGAVHMPALERRIAAELGYRAEWSAWHDVFRYSKRT